jgi:uncharacterized membrane protein
LLSSFTAFILILAGIFMGRDLLALLRWWLCILIVGWIFLPLTGRVFARFFDGGYLFSKTIGLALITYGIWLCSSLRILPFSRPAIVALLIAACSMVFLLLKGYRTTKGMVQSRYRIFLGEEALFLCGLVVWAYIRGLQPDIHGLEKFMNYGFVNSTLRTSFMPPPDMWFAGETINYYYFGHLICALLIKLTSIKPSVAYNLMIATLFSLTFSLVFSLAGNLVFLQAKQAVKKIVAGGLVAALLVTCGGNLHTVIFAHLLPLAKRADLYQGEIKDYWYPDATRYIGYNPPTEDKTIHEFPCYSFVVADLHSHVLNIPFVISFMALLLAYFVSPVRIKGARQSSGDYDTPSILFLLCAVMLAVFYMTNPWDLPIYCMVGGFIMLYTECARRNFRWKTIAAVILQSLAIISLCAVLVTPFLLHFKPFFQGLGFTHTRSPFYQLMVLWGYQLLLVIAFAVRLVARGKSARLRSVDREMVNNPDMFVLLLYLAAIVLIIVPEIIYVKDIYISSFHRANTMFKLTYQVFILFGIGVGYSTVMILSQGGRGLLHWGVNMALLIVLALPLLYPFHAVTGYYGSPMPGRYRGLDGLLFLNKLYPGDSGAVEWFNTNIPGQPVILEANGDSYTDHGRISMATGLPTVLGWFVHQWLWRGDAEMVSRRAGDVAAVYESDDHAATRAVLAKYGIAYIIIGTLERDRFKQLKEAKLLELGRKVFDTAGTMVIQLN